MIRTSFVKAVTVATVAAAAFVPAIAQAQNVVNFSGSVNVRDEQPGGGGSFLLLDFLTNNVPGFGTPGTITTIRDTDLPGVALGQVGTMADLRASNAGFTGLPQANFVTLGGYTFTLTSSTAGNTFGPISLFQSGPNTFATFNVSGTVTGGAFGTEQRAFNGAFDTRFLNTTPAALFAQIDGGGTANASFSATFNIAGPTNVIPEPSTYALMASGVAMLGFYARRRRQA